LSRGGFSSGWSERRFVDIGGERLDARDVPVDRGPLDVVPEQRRQDAEKSASASGLLFRQAAVRQALDAGVGEALVALAHRARRLRRAALPHRLDEFDALVLEDALHAADGVALAVEQVANAAQKIDVLRAVVTPPAAALHRLDLGKSRFPKPQHVLRQVQIVRDFADSPKCVGCLLHAAYSPAPRNSPTCARRRVPS
jgi:hypothetical protein